jgi:hypothetical protein
MNSTVDYNYNKNQSNNTFKRPFKSILILGLLIFILGGGIFAWFSKDDEITKIQIQIDDLELHKEVSDFTSINEIKEGVLERITILNQELSDSEDKLRLLELKKRLNSVFSKKVIELMEYKLNHLKSEYDVSVLSALLIEFRSYKQYITDEQDDSKYSDLLIRLNDKINTAHFLNRWDEKNNANAIENSIKQIAKEKWNLHEYIGGDNHFVINNVQQISFTKRTITDSDDYKKIEINFTSFFTSFIDHYPSEYDMPNDASYQVTVSGKIILEGSKDLNPDFRYNMVNDIKINADKL